MEEHRVIEKLVALIRLAAEAGRREGRVDLRFVEMALDFLKTYADRCHHGKEEGILFRALERKSMAPAHRAIMDALIEEHRLGRRKVRELSEAAEAYGRGEGAAEALRIILDRLEFLAEFYPAHIRKEDKSFFLPVMDYLDEGEKAAMIAEEMEFDRKLIHELYREKVEALEAEAGR
jgi:hemerythrin-like domain-containing protein